MKLLKISFLLLTITLFAVACQKDDDDPPFDLGGTTWEDSANINSIPYKPFIVAFAADGTANVTFATSGPFKGFWNKSPNSQIVNFYFTENSTTTWKAQGTLNGDNNKIESGVLTRLTPSVYTGTFRLSKK